MRPMQRKDSSTWLAIQQRLAILDKLSTWGVQMSIDYVLCDTGLEESISHLFFDCIYFNSIWNALLKWLGVTRHSTCWETEITWLSQ
ncbi:hypothetical protein P3S67_020628 [Capsicum chacoense]